MDTERQPAHENPVPPLLERALQLRLQSATRLTWVGAGWAALCGIIAAGTLHLNVDTIARALLTLLLVDAVLGSAWTALFRIRDPSGHKPPNTDGRPITPVTEDQVSLAPRVIKTFHLEGDEDFRLKSTSTPFWASIVAGPNVRRPTWWPSWLASVNRRRYLEVGLLFGLGLLLGLALGRGVAVIVALSLLFPLVTWFAFGGHSLYDSRTRAIMEIGLPWSIGVAAFASFPATELDGLPGLALAMISWAGEYVTALAVGLLFVVAYYGQLTLNQPLRTIEHRALLNLPQVVAVVLLVVWRQPILAGVTAILVLAQMLFQPYLRWYRVRWYLHSTQWMFMGVMLSAAIGVAAT